jgi:hypothetical protein
MTVATLDDGSTADVADVIAHIETALNALRAIASSGDKDVDAEILSAEQALRRARIALLNRTHTARPPVFDDIVKRCIDGNAHTNGIGGLLRSESDKVAAFHIIQNELLAAIDAEREACAKLVETMCAEQRQMYSERDPEEVACDVVAAIRNRSAAVRASETMNTKR